MGDGMLSLSWNNHHATFCDILTKLREKESYTDVTLSCEGKFYPLHKLVLSTCSEYFERIFEKTPCKHPVIVLNDIKCRELEALLSYMYAGEVSVPQSNLAMLIKVAEVLQIKGLAVPDTPPTPAKSKSSSLESGVDRGSPHPPKRRRTEERLVDTTRTMHEPTSPNVRVNPTDKGRQVTHEELHTRKDQEGSDDPLAISDLGEDYYAAEIKEEIIEDVVDSEGNQAGRTDHNLDYDAQLAPFKSEGNSRDSIPGHTSSAEYSDPQYEHLNPSSMQTSEMNPGPSEIIEWQDGIVESDVVSGEGCSGVGLLQPSSPMLSQQTPQLLAQQGVGTSELLPLSAGNLQDTRGNYTSPKKSYSCPHCSYLTPKKHHLKVHLLIHTGEKPFACKFCSFKCARSGVLKNHVRRHTGEKPYVCTHCPYRSVQLSTMKKHIRIIHSTS
ncbi:zinc finger and BTB domain-containing protein 17-like isoform X3 [Penaeus japonicus]|uniref:zinc finger and BTB domain-containing protein 17-like isoform X3 n=1 Tax=Penaeus japonicus TaxID=27405 RepID=UPI001C70D4F6|nr:zinc finger and BTB domain-containing protein 17-like isoform X3 [Penaeus japonicus]